MIWDLIDFSRLRRALVYALYLVVVLAVQALLLSRLPLLGVHALFLPAAVIAVGMLEDGVWGAVFGLALGILADAGIPENLVLFSLLFPVFGFAAGFISTFFMNKHFLSCFVLSVFGRSLGSWLQQILSRILPLRIPR